MKLKKEFRRDSKIILLIVIMLTLLSINLSYSVLFSVKTSSTIQEINAGNLSVVIDNTSTPITEDLLPTKNEVLPTSATSSVNTRYSTVNFTNNGTLKSDIVLTINNDYNNYPSLTTDSDFISLSYLNVGIFNGTEWLNFGDAANPSYYKRLTDFNSVEGVEGSYSIFTDTLDPGETKNYRVYVWLSESTPVEQIGKLVYLNIGIDYATSKLETMTAEEIALLS